MIDYDARSWVRIVFQIHGSVLPRLLPRILATAAMGGAALYANRFHAFKMPSTAHALLGVALGLLLVFRTNASYDRYWEGRRLFGAITNRCRDLTRQAVAWLDADDPATRAARASLQRHVRVFFALLRQHLRGERDLAALGITLSQPERDALEPLGSRPNLALLWLTFTVRDAARRGALTELQARAMDDNLTALMDSWGGTDRIRKTPIPFAYAQHIKSFLALFCFSAPFALVESMGPATPLVAGVVAFGLFGIEEIGVEIEDPFGDDPNDLPVDRLEEGISRDTAALLAASPLPDTKGAPT